MSDRFARVVVLLPVRAEDGPPLFDYHLPEKLVGEVGVGSLVTVPFGRQLAYAVVVQMPEEPAVEETRPVRALAETEPALSPAQVELARWMSREYLAPLWRCVKLMLPPGMVGHADVKVALEEEAQPKDALTTAQEDLFHVLDRRGPLRGRQLDRALPREAWRRAASQLARRRVVTKSPVLVPPRVRPKSVRTATWIGGPVGLDAALSGLRSACYPDIVRFLRREEDPVEVSWVYAETGCSYYHLKKLAERDLVAFDIEETWRDPLADETFVPDTPPALMPDQRAVWDVVRGAVQARQPATFLLHGVTGSGKTEIYLRAVAEVIEQGRQAIVLVPEISLTPQTTHRFGARFGRRIAVLHSALSDGERYDAWRRARAGVVDIVIGPRSALFTPFPDLGLIVLDEEHDTSYKQEEVIDEGSRRAMPRRGGPLLPFYHARDAAETLARLTNSTLILGSATPSLRSYYRARRGEIRLLEMPRRIMGHARRLSDLQARYQVVGTEYHPTPEGPAEARYLPLPPVHVVDMRAELQTGNRSIFSRSLSNAMDEALERDEQTILFLNRRGTATFVLCRDCGYVARCPQCDVPLTYHKPHASLVCHHCDYREDPPSRCPRCDGRRIKHFGLGTELVEQEVHQRWGDVRTLRWDQDTARDHATHAAILHLFSSGLAHVLVGTQMIAKGLDLPLVTVVGVISADTALNLPDFRAGERTFQLLEQVAGRAGRGLRGGRVVIQTYHPDHYAIRAAEKHDYEGFAREELAFRRQLDYPPYVRMARLLYRHPDTRRARAAAVDLAEDLRTALARAGLPPTDVIGPAPAFFARLGGNYRWQILLRHADPPGFLRGVDIDPGWQIDVDPVSVL